MMWKRVLWLSVGLTFVGASLVFGSMATRADATTPGRDGRIAFSRMRLSSDPFRMEIFVANADGTHVQRVTHAPANYLDEQPDWSPDGRAIAFARCPSDLKPDGYCRTYVVKADGSGLKPLGRGCTTPSACEYDLDPAWSPDGKTLALTHEWGPVRGAPPNDQVEHSEIFLMAANGANPRQLTHVTEPREFTADVRAATWSPDGSKLVFTVHNSDRGKPGGGRALFVVHGDGSGAHRLTAWNLAAGDHPDWAPDGSRILFAAVRGENLGDLYTIGANGRGLKRLTHLARDATLLSGSFSPDGTSIVFATSAHATPQQCTNCPTYPDVFVMDTDGTDVRPVTRSRNWDGDPDWGHDPP